MSQMLISMEATSNSIYSFPCLGDLLDWKSCLMAAPLTRAPNPVFLSWYQSLFLHCVQSYLLIHSNWINCTTLKWKSFLPSQSVITSPEANTFTWSQLANKLELPGAVIKQLVFVYLYFDVPVSASHGRPRVLKSQAILLGPHRAPPWLSQIKFVVLQSRTQPSIKIWSHYTVRHIVCN